MSDSVRMVQCARDVMDLIAEIGRSLEYVTIISVLEVTYFLIWRGRESNTVQVDRKCL